MTRVQEPPVVRWRRQAEEAKIRKEKLAYETREKTLHDLWASEYTRAKKHDRMMRRLAARAQIPRDYSETNRRAKRVLRHVTEEYIQRHPKHRKKAWTP